MRLTNLEPKNLKLHLGNLLLNVYLWWFEWVVCGKMYSEKKDSPLICTVRLKNKHIKKVVLSDNDFCLRMYLKTITIWDQYATRQCSNSMSFGLLTNKSTTCRPA